MIPWWWSLIAFWVGLGVGVIVWAISYRVAFQAEKLRAARDSLDDIPETEEERDQRLTELVRSLNQ